MENLKSFENSGNSYTEAGFYDDKAAYGTTNPTETNTNPVAAALADLLALHHREIEGDETITYKEWATAINNGDEALKSLHKKS